MQLADALEALQAIRECAESDQMDMGLRLAWIGHRAAEAEAVAAGDYTGAQRHKTKCNSLAGLMRMYARAAALEPIVIGGAPDLDEAAGVENAMGRSVWYRPGTLPQGDQ